MARDRTIGIWAIIAGIVVDNMSYLVDLIKDHTGVIILGDRSVAGIVIGIGLILGGMILLLRQGAAGPRAGRRPPGGVGGGGPSRRRPSAAGSPGTTRGWGPPPPRPRRYSSRPSCSPPG